MITIYIIMLQGKVYHGIFFQKLQAARNYIKFQNPTRKFKESEPNVFTCTRYGTTFRIVSVQNNHIVSEDDWKQGMHEKDLY